MSGYTKLHNSLLTSSIWDEADNVRIVWVTLLSMVEDSRGFVNSSLPGLAHMARKSREDTVAALKVLESPDPDSKNPDNEGRRIKRVEGGWVVLNYEIYRATKEELSVDPNTVASRERMRRYRERKSQERNGDVTTVTGVTSAYASGDASASEFGKCENLFFGDVPTDILELAPKLIPTEKAGEWQDYVQREIENLGYLVEREVVCEFDGQSGRIDLVAKKGGHQIAIELDYRTPRHKSVRKVQTFPIGIVLLRDPKIIRRKEPATLQYEIPLTLGALGEVFLSTWSDFISDRKERRKAVTSRAAKMILTRLSEKPERAVEALRKMIEKGWTSFEWPWIDGNSFGKPTQPARRENINVPITRR